MPSTAVAATVSLTDDGTVLDYKAAPGEANQFTVLGINSGRQTVQDGFGDVTITPVAPCTSGMPGGSNEGRFASCPADTLTRLRADLGDGADPGIAEASPGPFSVELHGGDGPDRLFGTRFGDELYGDAGADSLNGGPGNDTIFARDGVADQVDCGPGTDVATVDAIDAVTDCETVLLPDDPPSGPDRTAPVVVVRSAVKYRRAGAIARGLRIPVACSEACTVKLELVVDGRTAKRRLHLGFRRGQSGRSGRSGRCR